MNNLPGLPRAPMAGDAVVFDGSSWKSLVLTGNTAGPAVVGPAPQAIAPRCRPFVLRCPNCSAPTPSGAATCVYCNVPLVWEPVESLSRDDAHWRAMEPLDSEADDEPYVIGYGPEVVHAFCTAVLQKVAQVPMLPSRLYVPPRIAEHFSIEDVRVGKDSQMRAASGVLPASAFSVGRGSLIACDAATPGVMVALIVQNKTAASQNFEAMIRGKKHDPFSGFPGNRQREPRGGLSDTYGLPPGAMQAMRSMMNGR